MSQVLVVGAGPTRFRMIDQGLNGTMAQVVRKGWKTFLLNHRRLAPALVIYDLAGEDTPQLDVLLRLPTEMPETRVLYLAGDGDAYMEKLSDALQQPEVDFILDTNDPREVRLRANRLLARIRKQTGTAQAPVSSALPSAHSLLQYIVPQLHASNGRLDARRISELYGIPLAALSRALGRSEQAVHKTPTAAGIQQALRLYERIASLLLHLTASDTGLRAWMNTGSPELEDNTPMALILNGEGEVVSELLEDVLRGEPA